MPYIKVMALSQDEVCQGCVTVIEKGKTAYIDRDISFILCPDCFELLAVANSPEYAVVGVEGADEEQVQPPQGAPVGELSADDNLEEPVVPTQNVAVEDVAVEEVLSEDAAAQEAGFEDGSTATVVLPEAEPEAACLDKEDVPVSASEYATVEPNNEPAAEPTEDNSQELGQDLQAQQVPESPVEQVQEEVLVPMEAPTAEETLGGQIYYSDDPLQDLWMRFFNYEASCLKADLVINMQIVKGKRWACLGGDLEEQVIARGAAYLPLTPDIERLASRLTPQQNLQYGWPAVALNTREGLKIAPLIVVNLAPPPYSGGQIQVKSLPAINPAVIRVLWAKSGDIDFLRSRTGDILSNGAVAMSRYAQNLCQLFGLDYQELDPMHLLQEVPTSPGVYNMAVAVVAESMPMARPVLNELQSIADCTDWNDTGVSRLFGIESPDIRGRNNTPVMPFTVTPNVESAMQMVRHHALNVFNLTQRDLIDQIIVTICANAWMDQERVLIVSDDERKLDELCKLAGDVHLGLLVRTCCESDIGADNAREAMPISKVAEEILHELESTRDSLESIVDRVRKNIVEVERERRVALEGAAKRDKINLDKRRLEKKRLDLAKRLWDRGAQPTGLVPKDIGQQCKALQKTWLMSSLRAKSFMRGLKCKDNAKLEDLLRWSLACLSIAELDEALLEFRDVDKYNTGSANYRWASSSLGAVSAVISYALRNHTDELKELSRVRVRDERTRAAIDKARPYLYCWATDYFKANEYLKMEGSMFDVVVLDDAHRLNLVWGLPFAFRARRLVIIGDKDAARPSVFLDEKQLSDLSSLYDFDREIMKERGLDYGASSILSAFSQA